MVVLNGWVHEGVKNLRQLKTVQEYTRLMAEFAIDLIWLQTRDPTFRGPWCVKYRLGRALRREEMRVEFGGREIELRTKLRGQRTIFLFVFWISGGKNGWARD
jgi:hypothetical protein